MRKYAALHAHLNRRNGRPEMLSFEDIEAIIGRSLPLSAVKHRSFWANDNKDYQSDHGKHSDREDKQEQPTHALLVEAWRVGCLAFSVLALHFRTDTGKFWIRHKV